MVFCDPPYNVNYKGRGKKNDKEIMNDNMDEEKFVEFCTDWAKTLADNLKSGGVYYVCSGYSSYPTFLYALRTQKLYFSQPIVWVKDSTSLGWNDYRYKHEMVVKGKNVQTKKAQAILYGWNGGRHYFSDVRDEADVWTMKRRASNTMSHPTQKPVDLIKRAILNSSKRGETVLDIFAGSGSTMVAAHQSMRTCLMVEKDPKYCHVIAARWEALNQAGAA